MNFIELPNFACGRYEGMRLLFKDSFHCAELQISNLYFIVVQNIETSFTFAYLHLIYQDLQEVTYFLSI